MKINTFRLPVFYILFFILLINVLYLNAQSNNIKEKFKNYTEPFEEVVYTHLNKSTYIKGEKIGFTSYVLNKKNKKPSKISTNLYCVITDGNDNVIKKKLLHVIEGTTNNVFEIDSTFTGGTYKFKTYTNWMLNFKQQNYHIQTIKVLDPNKQENYQKEVATTQIDAQFLPEGGHILNNVINTIGVVLKDEKGFGIPNLSGKVLDENNKTITTFKVNKLGIGRFSLLAKANKNYRIVIPYNNNLKTFYFKNKIDLFGVNLKLKEINNKVIISLITNNETLKNIKNSKYTLISQNGKNIETKEFLFRDSKIVSSKIKLNNLPTGLNIFTLFDNKNQPISERLFFNYFGLNLKKSATISASNKADSITLNLKYSNLLPSEYNNISVSILPVSTLSYSKDSNLVSQTLVQPYIKGTIEKGSHYFNNITKERKYDLDNLLITQGWSSYNWNEIFNYELNSFSFNFEQGVSIKENTTDKKESLYLLHGIRNKDAEYIKLKKGENTFKSLNFFPVGDESLNISKVTSSGKLYKPGLYVQFFPSQLPKLNEKESFLNIKEDSYTSENKANKFIYSKIDKVQQLDPITVKANKRRTRLEAIKRGYTFGGRVLILDNSNYNTLTLAQYLSVNGVIAYDNFNTASLEVSFGASTTFSGNANALFFLNDMPINDPTFFYQYPLDIVDYIVINRDGIGEGMRGANGVIRIYTDPLKNKSNYNRKSVRKFEFPLTFSESKKFYVPKYNDYTNSFFKEFGVIDWLPRNSIDNNGNVKLKFENKDFDAVKLFIEGITSEGEFILEEKLITFE